MKQIKQTNIRNFSIIAHIDHGKSTLADRILELCHAVDERTKQDQFLDKMDLERERGITIKAQAVRLFYDALNGERYLFNLIDTPGHVDFTYEVSRSLAACDGAILVVDATQGVEAQTMANVYLALDNNLEILPVINKIDLPSANIEKAKTEIEDLIGLDSSLALPVSAKSGEGVREVLEAIIKYIPPPKGESEAPLQALLFDAWFDSYRGVIILCRVFAGKLQKGTKIKLWRGSAGSNQSAGASSTSLEPGVGSGAGTGNAGGQAPTSTATGAARGETQSLAIYEVQEVGAFSPQAEILPYLSAGEVGFVIAGIKDIHQTQIGDTLTEAERPCAAPLTGFKEAKSMVFSGVFPVETKDYHNLKDALEKLRLNDASFKFEPETSQALGFGFRCGFLGLLHMEIIQERLEREYALNLITTAPTVVYEVVKRTGEVLRLDNPASMPESQYIEQIREPVITATLHVPTEYVGAVMQLCEEKRGKQRDLRYGAHGRVLIEYDLPLAEVVFDFYDRLKSVSRGYASCDYELRDYAAADLVRLDILINGERCDALSLIVHKERAFMRGQALCTRLKDTIPRQQFEVAIQAALGSRVIARTTVKPYRKNVTAKCYGGDITRKRKLLEKQKEGKKRMKSVGSVEIPQEAFLAVLKTDES